MIVFLSGDTNPFTTYLNPSLNARKVRLICCSLYNSWYNLIGGIVTISDKENKIPDSHYKPQTLAKEFAKLKVTLTTGLPHEWNLAPEAGSSYDSINQPIKDLLGYKVVNNNNTFHWKMPYNYEIHCDLVQSYDDGKLSHAMAKFPPKGNPFDLVEYRPISLYYDICDLVTEVNIAIKVDGKTVNFNGRQISLVLEFI